LRANESQYFEFLRDFFYLEKTPKMKTLSQIKEELLPTYLRTYANIIDTNTQKVMYSHEDILKMVDKAANMIYNNQTKTQESVLGDKQLLQE
jgi:hypothetical protein